ncbi:unnamed protein product [Cryptosporidium hominis]|uniref:Uncharacterized protein n=1 Tax=Cryptosporidium hominis TaxID=237895 RepID=A0A0S4THD8_CRYHO|nr:hypothetical protein [Cryptosporidium hominis TU502]OLQ19033.1 hypothetical protein ChTU502y2012_417g0115 [Cryptosporidium hominis]PPA62686.1 hypothetical protein ChUKH1_12035 [Cryptosporidium hominis]PPS97876.1 Uncharacterized protein GY17_00000443 [Cryptosporidium hominis]CUV06849.1 unnamed protein product [Cryptosporidium hominis]|eukprot:PPS97876.1 Uncharacterized protein GY17_00000443 [Cryptosporidium hominis]
MTILYSYISLLFLFLLYFSFGSSLKSNPLGNGNYDQAYSDRNRSSSNKKVDPKRIGSSGGLGSNRAHYSYNSRDVNNGGISSQSRTVYSRSSFSPGNQILLTKPGSSYSTPPVNPPVQSSFYKYYLESIGKSPAAQSSQYNIYGQRFSNYSPLNPHRTPFYDYYLSSVGQSYDKKDGNCLYDRNKQKFLTNLGYNDSKKQWRDQKSGYRQTLPHKSPTSDLQIINSKDKQSFRSQQGSTTKTEASHSEKPHTSELKEVIERLSNEISTVTSPVIGKQPLTLSTILNKEDYQLFRRVSRCCILIQDFVDIALMIISNIVKTWTGNSELLEEMLIQATTAFSILHSSLSSCKTKLLSFDPSNKFALSITNGPYIDEETVKHSEKSLDIEDEKQYKTVLRSIRKISFKVNENSDLITKIFKLKQMDQQCKDFGISSCRRALINILNIYSKVLKEELDKAQLAADIYTANEIFDESAQSDFDKYVLKISESSN